MPEIYRAKEPFAFTDRDGVTHSIRVGDLLSGDDPNYKGRESLFEKVEVAAARAAEATSTAAATNAGATETASAAPGERRQRSRPTPTNAEATAQAEAPTEEG